MNARLLLLTDRRQLPAGRSLLATLTACVEAGATHIVVREHDLDPNERHELIASLAALEGVTVISSRIQDPAAALTHEAAEAHEASEFWSPVHPNSAESRADATKIRKFGRSCHSREEVTRAAREGALYVTLSPFAASLSKPGYGPPLPSDAYAGHSIPVFALGGITPANAADAVRAGAHGVAAMGDVMRADDPAAIVRRLLTVLSVEAASMQVGA